MPKEKPLYPQNLPAVDRLKWIDMSPHELVGMFGGEDYRLRGELWASTGDATIVKNQKGHIYVITATREGIRWRLCESNDQLRDALSKSLTHIPEISNTKMDLSDARLEQLKAEADEVQMSHRCWVIKDLVIFDTCRRSGEQAVIRKGCWGTTTARFPFVYRDGRQAPSALPCSASLTVKDCDRFIGCNYYYDHTLVWALLTGIMDPTTRAPWLLYVGGQYNRREQPLIWSKELLDPSTSPNYDPANAAEVAEQLDGQLIAAFDNVHAWSAKMFDALLGVAPPADAKGRIDHAVRPILAGEEQAQYPKEMLAHCLPIKLVRPGYGRGDTEYCPEATFQKERGALMGSLFNALAYSMRHRQIVVDEKFPASLSDFVGHGRAVAKAMGSTPDEFDQALSDSLALRESLGNPVQDENYYV